MCSMIFSIYRCFGVVGFVIFIEVILQIDLV